MIKANELRTGNLLQGEPLSIPREGIYSNGVTAITAYGIHLIESGVRLGTLQPIPLTPEVLDKCGFFSHDKFTYHSKNTHNVITKNHNGGFAYWHWQEQGYLKDVHYLHELQNIFYALKGEELTVTF